MWFSYWTLTISHDTNFKQDYYENRRMWHKTRSHHDVVLSTKSGSLCLQKATKHCPPSTKMSNCYFFINYSFILCSLPHPVDFIDTQSSMISDSIQSRMNPPFNRPSPITNQSLNLVIGFSYYPHSESPWFPMIYIFFLPATSNKLNLFNLQVCFWWTWAEGHWHAPKNAFFQLTCFVCIL